MRFAELSRTTAFRWSAVVAAAFGALSLVLFAFVYWQTAGYASRELDGIALAEGSAISAAPPAVAADRLRTWLLADEHHVRYGLLVDGRGRKVAGNMASMPGDLPADGVPRSTAVHVTGADDDDGDERDESTRGLALRLADGGVLVLGLDTEELEHTEAVLLRALELGLVPMVALSLLGGMLLGRRALDHVAAMDRAIARVMHGDIAERLPMRGSRDEFDRLAGSVNAMLDDLERLFEEVRGVGDSIAHDLRTPLTRARVRLERSRNVVRTTAEFRDAIDEALHWLDQTFSVIAAILRIGEIEHGRRRAAFRAVALGPLLREVGDLYEPLAEERGLALCVDLAAPEAAVTGDRELLFEAVANLVDNALKFSGTGGVCSIALAVENGVVVMRVDDRGPGIPEAERVEVLKRFHRSERSRNAAGNGLGLSLVSAVARLHGFELSLADNAPGCRAEIRAPALVVMGSVGPTEGTVVGGSATTSGAVNRQRRLDGEALHAQRHGTPLFGVVARTSGAPSFLAVGGQSVCQRVTEDASQAGSDSARLHDGVIGVAPGDDTSTSLEGRIG